MSINKKHPLHDAKHDNKNDSDSGNTGFSKEITKLYQQRKASITSPKIKALENNMPSIAISREKHHSLTRKLSILLTGGLASFGILAVISHLANQVPIEKQQINDHNQVTITQIQPDVITPTKNEETIKVALPPKPLATQSQKIVITTAQAPQPQANVSKLNELNINTATIESVALPKLMQPNLVVDPIYQVMPKYSTSALQANHSGAVTLDYKIKTNGHVDDVKIIDASVNRELQRAAKQALSKWQYPANSQHNRRYQIIFEFNLKKDH